MAEGGTRHHRRRAPALSVAVTLALALLAPALQIGHAAPLSTGALSPPLPTARCDTVAGGTPCAGNVLAHACVTAPMGQPNSWSRVDSITQASSAPYSPSEGANGNWYAYRLVVDPWTPCLMYRIDPTGQRIDRSDDAGATWRVILDDTSTGSGGGAFAIAQLAVLAPHVLFIAEDGAGDAVVSSPDAGATWHISNAAPAGDLLGTGLAGQFVPSIAGDPAGTLYAATFVTAGPGPGVVPPSSGVYVSRDGGQTWAPSTPTIHAPVLVGGGQAGPQFLPVVSTDPLDSTHAFYLDNFDQVLEETTDSGATWTQRTTPPPPSNATPGSTVQMYPFLVAHSTPSRPVRLLAIADNAASVSVNIGLAVNVSDDGGQSWKIVQLVSALAVIGFAGDPLDQDRAMYIAQPPSGPKSQVPYYAIYTDNGFATQGLAVPTPVPVDGCCATSFMSADRQHRFYLDVDTFGAQPGTYTRAWFRYNPALPNSLKVIHPGGLGGCAGCSSVPAPLVATCKPTTTGSAAQSIAFDGRYLYYTNHNDDTPDGRGTIHRVDPATCAQSTIRVRFDSSAARAGAGFDPQHPGLDELAYDANHNVLLAETARRDSTTAPAVFALEITDPGSATREGSATATGRWPTTCIRESYSYVADTPSRLFAYDPSDDSVWGCDRGVPGHLGASTGAPLDHCFGAVFNPNDSSTGEPDDAWAMGATDHLWVQYSGEWHDVDLQTCEIVHQFTPRAGPAGASSSSQVSSGNSDAQMVCDPTSFMAAVPGLPATVAAPGVMMWSRDLNGTLDAFDLGDNAGATCPLQTTLRYLGPTRVDAHSAPLCLTAALALRGRGDGVAAQPVTFAVDGARTGSTVLTGADGVATSRDGCLDPASLSPGTHQVSAHYAGMDRTYLPADAVVDLVVIGAVLPPFVPPLLQRPAPQPPHTLPPLVVPEHLLAQQPAAQVAPPQIVPQAPGQQLIQLQATAPQREEQHQLAYAYDAADNGEEGAPAEQAETARPPQDEAPPGQYAMSGLPMQARNAAEPVLGVLATAGTIAMLAGLALRRRPEPRLARHPDATAATLGAHAAPSHTATSTHHAAHPPRLQRMPRHRRR